MKSPLECATLAWAAALWLTALVVSPVQAQSTTFTYQGQLDDAGLPASGLHDFRFRLLDAPAGGAQLASTLCADNVSVVNGVFTAQLDFGQQYATTAQRHLEIDVRRDTGLGCGDATGFVLMSPRQILTATPLASHANSAFALDAADGSPANAVFVDNAGKVGVGTTSPNVHLHVRNAAPVVVLQDTSSASNQAGYLGFWNNVQAETGWLGFGTPGSPHFSVVNGRASGDFKIFTGGSERFMVRSTGTVGIGTSAPTAKLDVRGSIRMGPVGEYAVPSAWENVLIVGGTVANTGVRVFGTGFASTRIGTGVYTIDFTPALQGTPYVVATAQSTGPDRIAMVETPLVGGCTIRIVSGSGTPVDAYFSLIAISPH